ncbi:chromate transporter [Caballeronia temeraria]|uniref:Chromate transporter n=1 Tax=Caballeronia temeraria TaxID=1777137 RepID=A0A157ZZG1_9BURK|nr:chromate transporter [Caballeronia temeraria]SAK50890.1 chromate transporter [Caballeronia temeraria]
MTAHTIRDISPAASSSSDADTCGTPPVPTSYALLKAFFLIGLTGFGGVLPWARRMLVERLGWMTNREFAELLPLAQLLPGPNVANIATVLGRQYRGAKGAAIAVFGLYLAPTIITIGVGYAYARWGHAPITAHLFAGLMPAATGLVIATVLKLVTSLPRGAASIVLVAATFIAVAIMKIPLLIVLAVLGPLGTIAVLRRAHKE